MSLKLAVKDLQNTGQDVPWSRTMFHLFTDGIYVRCPLCGQIYKEHTTHQNGDIACPDCRHPLHYEKEVFC